LKKGENVMIATMFVHERKRIMEYLNDERVELWEGDETLDRWNKGEIKVLVVDPRSIGHGLNMQDGGHRIIWYSPTYSRELYDQTNARLARTGQKNNVLVQRLLCTDTIDWAVAEVLRVKGDELSGLKNALEVLESMR
jgi:SNF2 family DNA or RNA helicase